MQLSNEQVNKNDSRKEKKYKWQTGKHEGQLLSVRSAHEERH